MPALRPLGLLTLAFLSVAPALASAPAPADAVRAMLDAQVAGWNSGDVARYMEFYVKSDRLRFASGGTITYGWKETLERYRKSYPDKTTMGTLTCTYLDIDVVSDDTALVFGRWELQRAADKPWGLFTLLVKKTPDGWRVAADHTSSGGK
ncbi:YybH family protein [Oleiharenicola sp. Vm1]|uniref:YybH family protein n=1 Tax=Oleiharenicola sp. Vm1 TaxID=3398393 RepID=UPI0039F4F0F9